MSRRVSHLAEIIESSDDAAAEVVMPDAIDDELRRQGVVTRRDPLGERETSTRRSSVLARDGSRWVARGGHGQEAR